jgi:hypothetical protein
MGFIPDKCRVVYCNQRRRVTRSLLVGRVGREGDAQRVVVATTTSAMSSDGVAAASSSASSGVDAVGYVRRSLLAVPCPASSAPIPLTQLLN